MELRLDREEERELGNSFGHAGQEGVQAGPRGSHAGSGEEGDGHIEGARLLIDAVERWLRAYRTHGIQGIRGRRNPRAGLR